MAHPALRPQSLLSPLSEQESKMRYVGKTHSSVPAQMANKKSNFIKRPLSSLSPQCDTLYGDIWERPRMRTMWWGFQVQINTCELFPLSVDVLVGWERVTFQIMYLSERCLVWVSDLMSLLSTVLSRKLNRTLHANRDNTNPKLEISKYNLRCLEDEVFSSFWKQRMCCHQTGSDRCGQSVCYNKKANSEMKWALIPAGGQSTQRGWLACGEQLCVGLLV